MYLLFHRIEEDKEQMKEDDKLSTEEIDDEISLPIDTLMMSDDENHVQKKKKGLTKQNDLVSNNEDGDDDDDSFWERYVASIH